jgi:hypothetical protein
MSSSGDVSIQPTETNLPKLIKIEVSDVCYETYPCDHDCILHYDDGTSKDTCLSGSELIEEPYWSLLSMSDQSHFKYLLNSGSGSDSDSGSGSDSETEPVSGPGSD